MITEKAVLAKSNNVQENISNLLALTCSPEFVILEQNEEYYFFLEDFREVSFSFGVSPWLIKPRPVL